MLPPPETRIRIFSTRETIIFVGFDAQLRHSGEISSNLVSVASRMKNSLCCSTCLEILDVSQLHPEREDDVREIEELLHLGLKVGNQPSSAGGE